MSLELPHNENAECYILGGILLNNDLLLQTMDVLRPDDFYFSAHKIFYSSMESLYDAGAPITPSTVIDEAKTSKQYKEEILTELSSIIKRYTTGIPSSSDLSYYIAVVKQTAKDRLKIKLNSELSDALYANDTVSVQTLESKLYDLSTENFGQQDGLREFGSSFGTDVLENAYKVGQSGSSLIGLPTGIAKLDKITAGLNAKELTILAARPATGKTALSLNIASYLLNQDKRVAFFSLEMSEEMLYLRLLASEARVDLHKLKTGVLNKLEFARVISAHDKLSASKLLIDDTSQLSPRRMETAVKKAIKKHGHIDMVMIDYVQLMESNSRKENRQQEVSEISRQIREIGRRHNTHIFALSQLSREPEKRASNNHRPQSSDLRDSGCLTGDTEIYLPETGEYKTILELKEKRGFLVASFNEHTQQYETDTCTNVFSTGTKPIYKLETTNGKVIRLTDNHKLLTPNGWLPLRDIQVGDKINVPTSLYFDGFGWDSIRSIQPDGIEETYDLTVHNNHNFVANNILVHNSLEQEADMVLMLYREEQYNPDAIKGSAELIMTKSRNSDISVVNLFYVKSQTRFENIFIT